MSLVVSWLVFPLVLGVLCLGCGLLLEQVAGFKLPRALLLPAGYSMLVVVGVLGTTNGTTAQLTTPIIVGLAIVGLGLGLPWRLRLVDRWAVAAGVGAYAAFGAPVFMSGQATFAGYIELDDTSTWLAFTDRLMTQGRTLSGIAPSTYQAALDWYWRQNGYPVGAFPPLGIGHLLVRTDSAWLIQPYTSFGAGLLALGLYGLLGTLIASRSIRALAAFVAAQPALLYGYALWGSVKELPASALLVLIAALGAIAIRAPANLRSLVPLAVATAAMVEILNFGGAVWVVPLLVPVLVVGLRGRGRKFVRSAMAFVALTLVLSLPPLFSASGFFSVTSKILTKESELGNLIHPLSWLQLVGIWPVGDFRLRPRELGATYFLIAVLIAAAVVGIAWSWRRRTWELPLYVGGTLVGCVIATSVGSPWVDAKALAVSSPALVVAAMAGAAWLFRDGRRVEAAIVAAAITGGVLWSNALAYHDVWLAPRSQLLELQTIGSRFSGDGPTLMTEYQPYGVRHFLRDMAPETPSELRTRPVYLLNGQYLPKGEYADLDQLQLSGVLVYRTLVLLRTPAASRPPAVYSLVWKGRFYDVWQRSDQPVQILAHLPLGSGVQAASIPRCRDVLRLARQAGGSGRLAAVFRPPASIVSLSGAAFPATWLPSTADPGSFFPHGDGTLQATVSVPGAGRYDVSIGGSFRRRLEIWVDGKLVGKARDQLNHPGAFTPFGSVSLASGQHSILLTYGGANLLPGSGGVPFALGPIVLSRTTEELPVTYVQPGNARSLCGKSLDWVEAVAG